MNTTKRQEWQFDYAASKLAEAAIAKRDTHTTKFKWWEEKKSEVMAKIRESGIEISESVAASYSNTKSGFGPQVSIDSSLERQLTECHSKLMEHDRMVREYDGWRQVLEANPDKQLPLSHEDWLYFFGQ